MRPYADLHLHSHCSDGRLSPAEVVRLAAASGSAALALTDHDTVDGVAEAAVEAGRQGLRCIPGVEIGVAWNGRDVHLLAYLFDPEDPALCRLLLDLRTARRSRMETMISRLRRLGLPLTFRQVEETAAGASTLGRPHLARALYEAGWIREVEDAFRHLIGEEGPAYVPNSTPDLESVIRTVTRSGGVPVLAHPGLYRARMKPLIEEAVAGGLRGLEARHPMHDEETEAALRSLARDLGLLVTGGTDYHGVGGESWLPGTMGASEEEFQAMEAARPGRDVAAESNQA